MNSKESMSRPTGQDLLWEMVIREGLWHPHCNSNDEQSYWGRMFQGEGGQAQRSKDRKEFSVSQEKETQTYLTQVHTLRLLDFLALTPQPNGKPYNS